MMVFAKSYFYLFLQFLLLFVSVVTSATSITKPKERCVGYENEMQLFYFNQKLDHYSNDTQYFTQRYLLYKNPKYTAGNPVYLLVIGAHEIIYDDVRSGFWRRIVDETQGLLLVLEHRMYGYSYFENGRDNTMDNLLYLNTKQALADLVYFRDEFLLINPTDIYVSTYSKWVALGLEYGGTLAAILRSKYPNKIEAAVTMNAKLLATMEDKDFYNSVENRYNEANVGDTIKDAFNELKRNFNSCATNKNELKCVENLFKSKYKDIFRLCSDSLSTHYDVKDHTTFFFWSLTTILSRAFILPDKVIDNVIRILRYNRTTPNALERLGVAIRYVLNSEAVGCLIYDYGRLINSYKNTSILAEENINQIIKFGLGYRQSLYQQCSERGQFETAYNNDGIFANLIPIDFYINVCKRVFVNDFSEKYLGKATKAYNQVYGGRKIKASNVIFILHRYGLWNSLCLPGYLRKNFGIFLKGDQYMQLKEWNLIFSNLKYYLRI